MQKEIYKMYRENPCF